MAENKPIKLTFAKLDPPVDERGKERQQSPVVEIANGPYYRKFDAKDAPFEVTGVTHTEPDGHGGEREVVDITAEEEAAMLVNSGHFVVVSEPGAIATGSTQAAPTSENAGRDARAPLQGKIGGATPATEQ